MSQDESPKGNNKLPEIDKTKADSESTELPELPEDLLDGKPEEIVQKMLSLRSATYVGNPIHAKMEKEHITQMLDLATQHDERAFKIHQVKQDHDFKNRSSIRRYGFAIYSSMIIFISAILFTFKENPNVLVPILTGLGGLISGGLGGYGLGRKKK